MKNRGNLNLIPGDVNGRIGMTATFDLVLSEINYRDAGTYTCLASNINGEARNSTYVTVAGNSFYMYYSKVYCHFHTVCMCEIIKCESI